MEKTYIFESESSDYSVKVIAAEDVYAANETYILEELPTGIVLDWGVTPIADDRWIGYAVIDIAKDDLEEEEEENEENPDEDEGSYRYKIRLA